MSKRSRDRPEQHSKAPACDTCGRPVRKVGEAGPKHLEWQDDFYCFLVRTGGGLDAAPAVSTETKDLTPQAWEYFDDLLFESAESSEEGIRLKLVRPAQRWRMRVTAVRGLQDISPGDAVRILVDGNGVAAIVRRARNQSTKEGPG